MSDKKLLFSVVHQQAAIDVDLYHRLIYGNTELTVTVTPPPSSKDSNTSQSSFSVHNIIQLHSRGCIIHNVYVDGSRTPFYLSEEADPTSQAPLFPPEFTPAQAHLIRSKLSSQLSPYPTGELFISLPDALVKKLTATAINNINNNNTSENAIDSLNSFSIKIEYSLQDPVNGFTFVGGKNSKLKRQYWHAYTTNNPIGLATSSWLPCFDGFWDQCTWQFSISIPQKISDITNYKLKKQKARNSNRKPSISGDGITDSVTVSDPTNNEKVENEDLEVEDEDDEDEDDDDNHEIIVVCSELMPRETPHPTDPHKKIVSFDISTPVGAQNIGFAIGPFESIPLTDPSKSLEDDEELDAENPIQEEEEEEDSSIPLCAFALPDRTEEVLNTCVFLFKTMEYYSRDFGSFPFNSMSFCFVSNSISSYTSSVGLCLCDDRLLFPPEDIDSLFSNPEIFSKALATQWSGVALVPKTWNDIWVTNGIAGYMAHCFIKKLMGGNEYRLMLRKRADQICQVDIGMPPLGNPHFEFPLTQQDLSFINLKAPVVLFILDKRMTKTEKSLGLSRAIPKIFIQSVSGDLYNSSLSTSHFIKVCERVSHSKLDGFFNQWVYGSGYPIFHVSQRFNKKRMFIEMGIHQVQASDTRTYNIQDREFVKRTNQKYPDLQRFPTQPIFTVCIFFSSFFPKITNDMK